MPEWMRDLTQAERKTLGGCFGGWALDALDAQIFSFLIPTLLVALNLSRGEAGLIGTITLLVSAIGGWLGGALSDRYGRARVLQITVLWYAAFTFFCGFVQNSEQLFLLRALQGLGFGAEWGVGAVLMAEVVRDKYRGRALGGVERLRDQIEERLRVEDVGHGQAGGGGEDEGGVSQVGVYQLRALELREPEMAIKLLSS